MKQLLEGKKKEEKQFNQKLEKNKKYKSYLTSIVDNVQTTSSADFREIQDILDRYRILKSANDDLIRRQEKHETDNEAEREHWIKFMKESNNKILNKNNEIASLQKELEQVNHGPSNMVKVEVSTNRQQEKQPQTIHTVANEEALMNVGQVFASVDNMIERFKIMRERKKRGSRTKKSNATQQKDKKPISFFNLGKEEKYNITISSLERIAEYIEDYRDIADEWREEGEKKKVER